MSGSLICVGIGMTLGAHITPLCRSYIENAEVVFSLVSNGIVDLWLEEMHSDVRSLQACYQKGVSRNLSYQEMVNTMIAEVKQGKKVVGAFYGHPGVFAKVPHLAIETAKLNGYEAWMEPGISAEDCLFSDLNIDPGQFGCQQYEASQFMFYEKRIEPSAYLILWQIGIAGDKSLSRLSTSSKHLKVLVDLLAQTYPLDTDVILYQAKVLPIEKVRKDRIKLSDLTDAKLFQHTTLVIPPSKKMLKNKVILDKLAQVELELSTSRSNNKVKV